MNFCPANICPAEAVLSYGNEITEIVDMWRN
jgi:hypothetical protein